MDVAYYYFAGKIEKINAYLVINSNYEWHFYEFFNCITCKKMLLSYNYENEEYKNDIYDYPCFYPDFMKYLIEYQNPYRFAQTSMT